jgi:hypothetical protein
VSTFVKKMYLWTTALILSSVLTRTFLATSVCIAVSTFVKKIYLWTTALILSSSQELFWLQSARQDEWKLFVETVVRDGNFKFSH